MKYVARILIPILVSLPSHTDFDRLPIAPVVDTAASATSQRLVEAPVPEAPQPAPLTNSVTGGTARQRELAAWALEQYRSAGLDLPVLQVHLHSDPAECKGNRGLFSSGSTPWKVTVCTEDQMVYLHEIGHGWSESNLSEDERSGYVEERGLESWNDPDTAWGDRGSEDAANTLAWGLVDDPISDMLPDGPLAQRNEAFRMLTGIDSPRITG
jgi:hypothetical protein